MSLHPRPYQVNAIQRARAAFAAGHRRILLVAPTGAGKTVVATMIVEGAIAKQRRVLVLAHRAEIIEQTSAKLDAIGVDHGIIQADHWRVRAWLPVQVASVQTLARRLAHKPDADILIWDEAHHVNANTYRTIIEAYPDAIHIGLTATPYRTDGRALGDVFEDLIVVAQIRELIDQGFLVQPRYFAPFSPDFSAVHTVAGEFNQRESSAVMNQPKLIGDIVETWQKLTCGLTTVCFAASVAHSKAITERFIEAGIPAAHLDGETPRDERTAVLRRLGTGEIQVLSNCAIISEGWDLPSCSCAILARPTESKSLHNQMIGRVLRASPGKPSALVLDHAGNLQRHGFPTDPQEFSLEGFEKRTKENDPSVRICPRCYCAFYSRQGACPECGWKPEAKQIVAPSLKEAAGELVEVSAEKRVAIASDRERVRLLAKWRATGEARGYKPGWAPMQFKTLFLRWPSADEESRSRLIHFPAFLVYEATCKGCGSVSFGCREGKGPHVAEVFCRGCQRGGWWVPAEMSEYLERWNFSRTKADEQIARMSA